MDRHNTDADRHDSNGNQETAIGQVNHRTDTASGTANHRGQSGLQRRLTSLTILDNRNPAQGGNATL